MLCRQTKFLHIDRNQMHNFWPFQILIRQVVMCIDINGGIKEIPETDIVTYTWLGRTIYKQDTGIWNFIRTFGV